MILLNVGVHIPAPLGPWSRYGTGKTSDIMFFSNRNKVSILQVSKSILASGVSYDFMMIWFGMFRKTGLPNYQIYLTSSTAQGGGGSFKNRKPIGELGCCEWGMAERSHWWTERCLRSPLFLSLFLWLSTYLPAYLLCIYLSIDLSISLFLSFI